MTISKISEDLFLFEPVTAAHGTVAPVTIPTKRAKLLLNKANVIIHFCKEFTLKKQQYDLMFCSLVE